MAAALRYVGITEEGDYLRRLSALPAPRQWLLCHQAGGETVMAAASGAEPRVLEQALRSVTAEFAPSAVVVPLRCHEPRHLRWLFRLQRARLLPAHVQRSTAQLLWHLPPPSQEGSSD